MARPLPHRFLILAIAATLSTGCPGPGGPVVPATKRSPAPKVSEGPGVAPPTGGVMPPTTGTGGAGIIANNGGSIIANNGASLGGRIMVPAGIIANNGGGIIANNGGGLLSDRGGSLVANNGGGYRLLAAPAQAPLAGATVRVLDAAGQPVKGPDGQPLETKTDANGNYGFDAALPARNLLVEAALPQGAGAVRAVVPREGTGRKAVDADLVSTLTTGYILDRYVRSQADPLATLEKLPADVEAETRRRAAAAVEAAGTAPKGLADGEVVATVEALRRLDPALDGQLETVRELLVVAGAKGLGEGLKATDVAFTNVNDLLVTPDGTLYILVSEDQKVWRLKPDGTLETAIGNHGAIVEGDDPTGQVAKDVALALPTGLGLDPDGRLTVTEKRGLFRLEADGRLTRLAPGGAFVAAPGRGATGIGAVKEGLITPAPTEWDEENDGPPPGETVAPFDPVMAIGYAAGIYKYEAGKPPQRLFQIHSDPDDWAEEAVKVAQLIWDGADVLWLLVENRVREKTELRKYTLSTNTSVVDADLPLDGTVKLAASGHLFVGTPGLDGLTVRDLRAGTPARPFPKLPAGPTYGIHVAAGPGDIAYGSRYGSVYQLTAAGPKLVAGREGTGATPPPGEATAHTFTVMGDAAVTPAGDVYVLDSAEGHVYRVGADGKITNFAPMGGGNVQQLRADPTGGIWMLDGDGDGIGKFDAAGVWAKAATFPGLVTDFAVAKDGTIYAEIWDYKAERHYKLFEAKAGGQPTLLLDEEKAYAVAVDGQGRVHVAGSGTLRRRDGAAWSEVLADARLTTVGILVSGASMGFDATGRAYVAIPDQSIILRGDPATKTVEVLAGAGGKHFAGSGTDAGLAKPRTPGFDAQGNLYFSDTQNRQVRKIPASQL